VVTAASASNILGILVAGAIAVRLHRTSAALAGRASRKLFAIAFVAASLFLAISTSDDLARFAFLHSLNVNITVARAKGGPVRHQCL
jgi:hypothetical protein